LGALGQTPWGVSSPEGATAITGNGICLSTLCRRFAARRIQRTSTQGSQSLALGLATSAAPQLISAPTDPTGLACGPSSYKVKLRK